MVNPAGRKVAHSAFDVAQHYLEIIGRGVGVMRRTGKMETDARRYKAVEFRFVDRIARWNDYADFCSRADRLKTV